MIAYREIDEAHAGRTIALLWRATETRADDLRAVADFMREGLPAGVRAVEAGGEPSARIAGLLPAET